MSTGLKGLQPTDLRAASQFEPNAEGVKVWGHPYKVQKDPSAETSTNFTRVTPPIVSAMLGIQVEKSTKQLTDETGTRRV